MINVLIQNGEQTVVLKLPGDPLTLQCDLSQIGIRSRLQDIRIKDDEDSKIQVKLFADSDIGNSLAVLFKPSHSLEDANLCAHMVENARPELVEELEQHIVHGQYYSPQAVMEDIKAMTEELISVTVNYYCPLQIHMTDEEYEDWLEVDNGYGIANEDAIRELVKHEQDRDLHNMADYFDGSAGARAKLISADWDVQEVGGDVDLIGKRENYVSYIAKRPRAERHFPQAESWLEKASDQGNSYAKYSLAKMHLAGLAAQSDTHKAIRLLKESANDGNGWAQYLLGKFCFRGEHTEKDMVEAEWLLNASAKQNNSQAQYLLAKLYLCEDGIPKNAEKALHWLWESAKQKNQYAQYQLGKMLLFGKDAEQDIQNGIALLSASAEQGNVYAVRLLQSYYSGRLKNPSVGMASVRLLSQLARIFENRLRRNEDGQRAVIEKKLRQKIEEKKQARGMKMG